MLKRPITINIAPSRWALAVSVLLAVATCLTVGHYGPPWLTAAAVVAFCAAIVREWRRGERWRLRWVPGIEGGWQRCLGADAWHPVPLRCDYLGPWLIGLRIAGRRHWLWPDSASAEERRELRRVLLWSGSATHDSA